MKKYTLIGENTEKVLELTKRPAAGIPSSYRSFGNNITYKKKTFAIVYAMPTSGKSEFVLQEALYLAEEHGWKTLIFSPETGDPEDIIALMVHKRLGKSVQEIRGVPQASREEILRCMDWLKEHFVIVNVEESITMTELFNIADEVEKELNWRADQYIIDNHNDLEYEQGPNGRQDIAIEQQLTYLKRQMKKRDAFAWLVTHTQDLGKPLVENGISYYPIPNPTQTRGGQALYRKGYLMINVWRCVEGLRDPMGNPYPANTSLVTVQKAKPTHVGTKGFQGMIYWDWKKSKFLDLGSVLQ